MATQNLAVGTVVKTPYGEGKIDSSRRESDGLTGVKLKWATAYVNDETIIAKKEANVPKAQKAQTVPRPQRKQWRVGTAVETPLGSGKIAATRRTDGITAVRLKYATAYVNDSALSVQVAKGTTVTTPYGKGVVVAEKRSSDGLTAVKVSFGIAYVNDATITGVVQTEKKKEQKLTDWERAMLTQVEFYFSNSNLPFDIFLKQQISNSPSGYVAISTIGDFKRTAQLCMHIPHNQRVQAIASVLRKSKALLQVNKEGTHVKRRLPLPTKLQIHDQMVYAKGFPQSSTIESIRAFFVKNCDVRSVPCVRMRRVSGRGGGFKGSIFVEFGSPEIAQRVAKMTVMGPMGTPLNMMMKKDYLKVKGEKYGNSNGNRNRDRKNKRKRDRQSDGAKPCFKFLMGKCEEGDRCPLSHADKNGNGKKEEAEEKYEPGLVLKITNLGGDVNREMITEKFVALGCKTRFIEYSRGEEQGFMRLDVTSEVKAAGAAEKLKGGTIGDFSPKYTVLEGEEEKQYYAKVAAMRKSRKGNKRFKGGRRGGRRGGRHGGQRRRRNV